MARNQEKAQSMLFRFREAMMIEAGVKRHPKDQRSLQPSTCSSIPIAEQGRRDLLREVHRKIGRIQDKEIELSVVRSLNDEINETIGRIRGWDERIRELGGLSRRTQRRIEEFEASSSTDGKSQENLVQFGGKFYFGRSRELPEVQDYLKHQSMMDRENLEIQKLKREGRALYAQVNHRYYGFLEESEEAQITAEEESVRSQLTGSDREFFQLDWNSNLPSRIVAAENAIKSDINEMDLLAAKEGLLVPTQAQVEEYLLQRRKRELLSKYT